MISVIIPVFNVEKYLEEAVESVVAQKDVDLEILIWDDGSTDATLKVALHISKRYPNKIKVFRNKKNLGIDKTLNLLLGEIAGDYVARFDGDDIMYPNRLSSQLVKLQSGVDICGFSFNTIDEGGRIIGRSDYFEKDRNIKRFCQFVNPMAHVWMCRREVYSALNGYRYAPVEDYDFLLRAIRKGYVLGNCNRNTVLGAVRVHSNNTASLQGLTQILARRFVYQIFKEGKSDFYSDDSEFKEYCLASDSRLRKYESSKKYLLQAVREKTFIKRVVFYLKASNSSSDVFMYYVRRFVGRVVLKVCRA